MNNQQTVVSAALRAVGNIVTGDDIQTQVRKCLLFCGYYVTQYYTYLFVMYKKFAKNINL